MVLISAIPGQVGAIHDPDIGSAPGEGDLDHVAPLAMPQVRMYEVAHPTTRICGAGVMQAAPEYVTVGFFSFFGASMIFMAIYLTEKVEPTPSRPDVDSRADDGPSAAST
jgi:hypothetical protein